MKKRNKKYKPRQVVQNPIQYIMGGFKRPDGEHLTELNVKNHLALVNILNGTGKRDDWDKLVGMSNMALVLAEVHFDDQYREMLLSGRDALLDVGRRYLEIDRFVLKGEEKTAIEDALEIHEAQLNALRVIDIERAFIEVQRRVRNKINTIAVKQKEK